MKTPAAVALSLLLVCTAARAATPDPSKFHLLDSSQAQLDPVSHGKADLFLLGLGLIAGGLVLGGAGFAVLYLCQEGTSCHSQTMTYVGYGLAAPGIIPLAAGLIIVYLFTGGRRGVSEATASKRSWAFSLVPINGGGLVGASGTF
jgi:hypothetical protein